MAPFSYSSWALFSFAGTLVFLDLACPSRVAGPATAAAPLPDGERAEAEQAAAARAKSVSAVFCRAVMRNSIFYDGTTVPDGQTAPGRGGLYGASRPC